MIPSPNHEPRNGTRVDKIAIHTAEGARRAADLGNYFKNPAVESSSHDGVDDVERQQYVDYTEAAWTILNANLRSDNLEICGFAHWSRDDWFQHVGMLDQTAQWIAERCKARGIPIRKLTPVQIDAGMSGVIGHADWSYSAIGWGNHTDPGVNFPWDYVLDKALGLNPAAPAPAPAPQRATAWPLPLGHYFGDITGPDESHGGINPQEQVWVKQVQEGLQRAGKAPGGAWADGVWEAPTTDAVRAWQASVGYQQTGRVYQVDWDLLVLGTPSAPVSPVNPAPSAPAAVPPFPLPRNEYFGDIHGPAASHGGFYESERTWIKMIQRKLQEKGYAPSYPGWADGVYEQPTVDAVTAWQHDHMPNTTYFGQVWWDDWAALLG